MLSSSLTSKVKPTATAVTEKLSHLISRSNFNLSPFFFSLSFLSSLLSSDGPPRTGTSTETESLSTILQGGTIWNENSMPLFFFFFFSNQKRKRNKQIEYEATHVRHVINQSINQDDWWVCACCVTHCSGCFRIELVRRYAHMGRRWLAERIASLVEELKRWGGSGGGRSVMSSRTQTHLVAL